jgi:hypothetical protein
MSFVSLRSLKKAGASLSGVISTGVARVSLCGKCRILDEFDKWSALAAATLYYVCAQPGSASLSTVLGTVLGTLSVCAFSFLAVLGRHL